MKNTLKIITISGLIKMPIRLTHLVDSRDGGQHDIIICLPSNIT